MTHHWGWCVQCNQAACSQGPAVSQTFPLSPERRTGMQQGSSLFSVLSLTGFAGWSGNCLWVSTPNSLSTLARDFTSSTAAVCVWLLTWLPSSQRPICREHLWHWRSNHIWPAPTPYRSLPHTLYIFISFFGQDLSQEVHTWFSPMVLFWSFLRSIPKANHLKCGRNWLIFLVGFSGNNKLTEMHSSSVAWTTLWDKTGQWVML